MPDLDTVHTLYIVQHYHAPFIPRVELVSVTRVIIGYVEKTGRVASARYIKDEIFLSFLSKINPLIDSLEINWKYEYDI